MDLYGARMYTFARVIKIHPQWICMVRVCVSCSLISTASDLVRRHIGRILVPCVRVIIRDCLCKISHQMRQTFH